ncbi:TPA: inovirus Gp2 family protein [Pseudomonas aeruginosa]|uniref:inovirus Gp2 family protein n=1 Tax=Pseudomonas aeruginosa TaxID=287 RepID=UPI002904E297|nr:inovirus Gp2 family protein [Pseudomonas aeruginosa]MDU0618873.1 inovirus Gp2 family protein [Pseudomonas aeruginosa]HBP1943289.1 inovirus Gp2 family protein [Pseudomonas aeruginosa]
MKRHQTNTNLLLHKENTYQGLPVMEGKGPFLVNHLSQLLTVMVSALARHHRVYAIRFDLRLPADKSMHPHDALTNNVIKRFYASYKEKIKHDRKRAVSINNRAHDSSVLYAWARETANQEQQHYHGIVFLNHDAYNSLGTYELGRKNNYNRLLESWASALKIPIEKAVGLVHIPQNATYRIDAFDKESQKIFFRRASYLCKATTKQYGNGQHGFGCSRC